MELLWDADDRLTARRIREVLYPGTSKAQHGTVQRLLQRLENKGFIDRDASHSVHQFSPRIDRSEYASDQLESLARKLSGGSIAPLITHLITHERLSADEITRLRAILDSSVGGDAT